MTQRRTPSPPYDIDVFCHASAYWKCAAALGRECNFPFPYNLPQLVLELFSVELFLKCLIRSRGKAIPRTHDFRDLLDALSKRDRIRIKARYYKIIGPKRKYQVTFDSVLKRTTGLFERARYKYEGRDWETDRHGFMGNEGLAELLRAVREVILERNPDFAKFWQGLLSRKR